MHSLSTPEGDLSAPNHVCYFILNVHILGVLGDYSKHSRGTWLRDSVRTTDEAITLGLTLDPGGRGQRGYVISTPHQSASELHKNKAGCQDNKQVFAYIGVESLLHKQEVK